MPSWLRSTTSSYSRTPPPNVRKTSDKSTKPTTFQGLHLHQTNHTLPEELCTFPQPIPSPSKSRPPSRSISNALPYILGGGKKKIALNDEGLSSSASIVDDVYTRLEGSPVQMANHGKAEDNDSEIGTCATCNSKVKWPRGLTEFRCATCLMINDLKVPKPKEGSQDEFGRIPSLNRKDTGGIPELCKQGQ